MSEQQGLEVRGHEPAVPFEQDTIRLANAMVKSGFFRDSTDLAKAVVKIMAGRELGLGPVASMVGIHVIEGKITLSANLMAAKIQRSRQYRYKVVELTSEVATIAFYEGDFEIGTSSYSWSDAERAGLAAKAVWRMHPRNMLFSRAMSNGAKWFCPEVFSGPTYTPDELGAEVDGEGQLLDQAPPMRSIAPPSSDSEPEPARPTDPEPPPDGESADPEAIIPDDWKTMFDGDAPTELRDQPVPDPPPPSAVSEAMHEALAVLEECLSAGMKIAAPNPTFTDEIARNWTAARRSALERHRATQTEQQKRELSRRAEAGVK